MKKAPRSIFVPLVSAILLLFCLSTPARTFAQAKGVPIVKGGTDEVKELSARIESIQKTVDFLTLEKAREQVSRETCEIELCTSLRTKPLKGREVWTTARKSYVRIGWYCLCKHCNDRHVNLGGGFYVNEDGVAATAAHCLTIMNDLREGLLVAVNDDGTIKPVTEILALNKESDVCLVRIQTDAPTTPLPLNTELYPGDGVWCYSNPMGRGPYFSRGVVNRFVQIRDGDETSNRIHVSSAWAPGSSGSAILNEFGNAIGLVSGIEMIQEPATKQTVMSVNRAARAADLMKLVKQPKAVSSKAAAKPEQAHSAIKTTKVSRQRTGVYKKASAKSGGATARFTHFISSGSASDRLRSRPSIASFGRPRPKPLTTSP